MAQRGGNRNQKLAAKAARRKQVVSAKQQAERLASSPAGRVAVAAASPVERCLRLADIFEAGIGHVILAKRLPSGALGCAFFLVDLFCLGAKDVFYREMAPSALDEHVADLAAAGQALVPIDPASAKKLVTGAVAFAAALGIAPARDYRTVVKIFDGIDAASSSETFTFGRDGIPVFIPGPSDTPAKMREIERALTKARGTDGWDVDVIAGLSPSERISALGVAELLRGREVDDDLNDGLVIEHEGSIEPKEG